MSWGLVVGKIFDWLPGRREHIIQQICKTKEQMDELVKSGDCVDKRRDHYDKLAKRLRDLEEKLKYIKA